MRPAHGKGIVAKVEDAVVAAPRAGIGIGVDGTKQRPQQEACFVRQGPPA